MANVTTPPFIIFLRFCNTPRLLGTKEYTPYIRCQFSYTFHIGRKAGYMANMAVVMVLPYIYEKLT